MDFDPRGYDDARDPRDTRDWASATAPTTMMPCCSDADRVLRQSRRITIAVTVTTIDTSTVDGLREILGSVDITSGDVETDFVGMSLVLHMQDGSTLPFFFTDSTGTIAARGQLKRSGE